MPHKQISELVLDGKHYLVIPKALVESKAPQLLATPRVQKRAATQAVAPSVTTENSSDDTPWEVLQRHLEQDMSMMQAWREHLQLSQSEVAQRLEVTLSLYQQYEKSSRTRRSILERVAKAMGISLTQIL